jgi:hypothetical protein
MRQAIGLAALLEAVLQSFHAEYERDFVRIGRFGVLFHILLFVDHGRDDGEVGCVDYPIQPLQKLRARGCIQKDVEIAVSLSDLVAVEDDAIVPPKFELEPLERRHNAVDVGGLVHHAKGQHEHGVLGVDRREAVVAAFVGVHNVLAEFHPALFQKRGRVGSRRPCFGAMARRRRVEPARGAEPMLGQDVHRVSEGG